MNDAISKLQRYDLIGCDSDIHIGPESCGDYVRYADVQAALQHAGQGEAEPVYAFRRKGLDDFCTCTEERYLELKEKPSTFEVAIFYTTPQPAVPEEKKRYSDSPYEGGYADGWNACRKALLSAGKEK